MIEINRKLYVKEDYSVDRASYKVAIALNSVREKFAENHLCILNDTSQESVQNELHTLY